MRRELACHVGALIAGDRRFYMLHRHGDQIIRAQTVKESSIAKSASATVSP